MPALRAVRIRRAGIKIERVTNAVRISYIVFMDFLTE